MTSKELDRLLKQMSQLYTNQFEELLKISNYNCMIYLCIHFSIPHKNYGTSFVTKSSWNVSMFKHQIKVSISIKARLDIPN